MMRLEKPVETDRIVLHSCCAPCSSALVEVLVENGIRPLLFYCNPNIYPQEEYEIRKAENKRYAVSLGLEFVDTDADYDDWKERTWALRDEPERGNRCFECFLIRLTRTALFAHEQGYALFATTLGTSRWKDLAQINEAGEAAAKQFSGITFWAENWKKGGLSERAAEITRRNDFYRQQYCGCEYSLRQRQK